MRLASPNLAYSVASSELNRQNSFAIAERRAKRPLQRVVYLDYEGRILDFEDVPNERKKAASNKRARSEFEEPSKEEELSPSASKTGDGGVIAQTTEAIAERSKR